MASTFSKINAFSKRVVWGERSSCEIWVHRPHDISKGVRLLLLPQRPWCNLPPTINSAFDLKRKWWKNLHFPSIILIHFNILQTWGLGLRGIYFVFLLKNSPATLFIIGGSNIFNFIFQGNDAFLMEVKQKTSNTRVVRVNRTEQIKNSYIDNFSLFSYRYSQENLLDHFFLLTSE